METPLDVHWRDVVPSAAVNVERLDTADGRIAFCSIEYLIIAIRLIQAPRCVPEGGGCKGLPLRNPG